MKIYVQAARNNIESSLQLWGTSPDTNILYILGYSGSGKSTKAIELAKDYNADVIHLDLYFEGHIDTVHRSKLFNKYLEEHFPEYVEIYDSRNEISKSDWGKLVEEFESTLLQYGRYMYSRGILVIVEGVQLMDGTLFPDKSFFKHVPTILLSTSNFVSSLRGAARDKITPVNFINNTKHNKNRKQQYRNIKHILED